MSFESAVENDMRIARGGVLVKPSPSHQFSDCLYNFSGAPDRFYAALEKGGFTLNYVVEDVKYLGVEGLERLAIAMLCFCDIPTERHRMLPHLEQYGRFGIGLTKNWGIRHGVQPVHYLSSGSPYCEDLREAFAAAMEIHRAHVDGSPEAIVSSFLATTLAYVKPTYEERPDNGDYTLGYSFEDECEWRFVPRDLHDYKVILSNPYESDLQ